jgi:glycosyltransferase involved in cell wall biosynthesis
VKREVLLLGVLPRDPWQSIHRYGEEIHSELNRLQTDINFNFLQPSPKLYVAGSFFARRVLYPIQSRLQYQGGLVHILDQSYSNLALPFFNVPVVITCHDLEFWRTRGVVNFPIRKVLMNALVRADRILCPSQAIKDELVQNNSSVIDRTLVVPNGFPRSFTPINALARKFLRQRLAIDDSFILLNVGTCQLERKNFDFSLELLGRLGPNFKLFQIGGELTSDQERIIKEYDLEKRLVMLGHVPEKDLLDWYRASDMTLMPSRYEGFGLPVVESMACGTPVLCSDISVLKEVSKDPGFYLPLEVTAWEHRLNHLSQNLGELESARERSLEIASTYSYETAARLILKVYEELLPP